MFFKALEGKFIVDPVSVEAAAKDGTSCNFIHEQSFIKIDLFFVRDEIRQRQLQRSITVSLPGLSTGIKVASAEDIILAKLSWYKKGGETSERQWRDVLGVLKVQKGLLDISYLESTAAALGITPLLVRARQQSE